MSQYIEIASTSMKIVVDNLLELGKLGAKSDKTCPAHKIGPMYVCRVKIEDDKDVVYSPVVRKGRTEAVSAPPPKVTEAVEIKDGERYTKEQLEEMTLAEIRKATGISNGGKQAILEQYLAQEEKADTEETDKDEEITSLEG